MFASIAKAITAAVSIGVQKPAQVLALSAAAALAPIPGLTAHIGKGIAKLAPSAAAIDLAGASFGKAVNLAASGSAKAGMLAVKATNTENFFMGGHIGGGGGGGGFDPAAASMNTNSMNSALASQRSAAQAAVSND